MKRVCTRLATALVAVTTAVAAVAFAAGPASAAPAINGGSHAKGTPWMVMFGWAKSPHCSGEQVNAHWVLLARHCITGFHAPGQVYHGRSYAHPGLPHRVDRVIPAPHGDQALVHLKHPYRLKHYPKLNLSFHPRSHGTGKILGFGNARPHHLAHHLKQARVTLAGRAIDGTTWRGVAQELTARTGSSAPGDSGGPLLVNGKVVGVCAVGYHGRAAYSVLSQNAHWLRKHLRHH